MAVCIVIVAVAGESNSRALMCVMWYIRLVSLPSAALLQSVLRLKEAGLTSAVITRREVETAGSIEALLATRKVGGANEPWISPEEALKDKEIQEAVRHNLVYALLRNVVERVHRARGSGSADSLSQATSLLDAALRLLVVHWRLRVVVSSGTASPDGPPPRLVGAPLPSLHGAMNRQRAPGAPAAPAPPAGGVIAESVDSKWFCIDGDAAAIVLRAALFFAVKDVVAEVRLVRG
jgi:hypothetical protein